MAESSHPDISATTRSITSTESAGLSASK